MVHIEAAKAIDGWMNEAELTWLAEQAAECPTIFEFGCWQGRTTMVLATNMWSCGTLFAVDRWKAYRENFRGGEPIMDQQQMDAVLEKFKFNLRHAISSGLVIPLRMEHDQAIHALSLITPDFVFLDGCHGYAETRRLVEHFHELFTELGKGLLACHDYDLNWPDCKRAIDESLPGKLVVPGGFIAYKRY